MVESPSGTAARVNAVGQTIEVVCNDMMCFKVDAVTLQAVTCCYYEPAAWNDPRGPQMSYGEWLAALPPRVSSGRQMDER